ncbi:hypothetical protein EKH15_24390, partial [Salmonella enterica subsp. enterica serovar Corvallis]|nr:hypothetical protein [Salmonella enterica subsp. enterica serovar Corvallis]
NSEIKLLFLNGKTVIEHLKLISDISLNEKEEISFNLQRKSLNHIKGYEYTGQLRTISGVDIGRNIYVYGINHNIQSSYGISNLVKENIRKRFNLYWSSINHE